jgi:tetratricopeptide (TPR) repeat protein
MFRLLGLQHGPDVGVLAAASLAGVPAGQARRLLTDLTRVQLLTRHSPARFGFHDLLRAYAAERAEAEEDPAARRAALGRLFDYYLHTGNAAHRLLYLDHDRLALDPPSDGVTPEPLAGQQEAVAWFEAEYPGLLAAVFQAGEAGFGVHAWQIAWMLSPFMDRRGHWSDWARVARAALAAASGLGDQAGVATAHRALGTALLRLGSRDDARAHIMASHAEYQRAGDQIGQARQSITLGMLAGQDGNDREALRYAEHALSLFEAAGHRAGQGRALNSVGWQYAMMGQVRRAIGPCERAVALGAELGDRLGEAAAWDSLSYCHRQLGDYPAAITCGRRAVELTGLIGDRYHQADALVNLGDTHQAAGDLAGARDAWQQAVSILDDLHHPDADQVRSRLANA